jgi:hypothetical protein
MGSWVSWLLFGFGLWRDYSNPVIITEPSTSTGQLIFFETFENGWVNFVDGGKNTKINTNTGYGTDSASLQIQKKGKTSRATTKNEYTISTYSEVQVSFYFKTRNVESGQKFFLKYSVDGGEIWKNMKVFKEGRDYENNGDWVKHNASYERESGVTKIMLRFQTKFARREQKVYIDNVEFSGLPTCKSWCVKHSQRWLQKCSWESSCGGCDQCTMPQVIREVTVGFSPPFNDWTGDDLGHSFDPGSHQFPPTFTDWNGDGKLDFFYNNHIRKNYAADFDFGLSSEKGVDSTTLGIEFLSIGNKTFVDGDSEVIDHDCHGSTFADMDGDGILDLLVSVGGGRGTASSFRNDNILFWGEETAGGDFRLVGGREAAVAAGIQCSDCRGRHMFVTDVNRDGLLDVFPVSDTRLDAVHSPTPLLLNNGDRTFTEHPPFQEFTRSILLTDADGDGHAQEYMALRGTCFRDPAVFDHSTWPHNDFCEVHPEKTTAIYKYDPDVNEMVLISPEYRRTLEDEQYAPSNKEAAYDSVSGDFDFDQKADQIVLFTDKMVFYYSSDRTGGELPLYNEDLDQVGSSEMNIPCSRSGRVLRLVDLDMDGQMELVLFLSRNQVQVLGN